MNRYWFGIHPFGIDEALEERILAAQESQTIGELAAELVSEAGPHVLPQLRGDEKHFDTIRQRHLSWLKLVFTSEDLKSSLQAELELYLSASKLQDAQGDIVIDGDSEIYEGPCWWWKCHDLDADGDPEYCYWEEWCDPFTQEPYDEMKCQSFGPDGEIREEECYDKDFCCC
jgi:hypothetical protein